MPTTRRWGKRTTVVMFGRQFGVWFYLFNIVAAMAAVAMLRPLVGWAALAAIEVAVALDLLTWLQLRRREGAALNPLLGTTSLDLLAVALAIAITAIIA